MPAHALPIEVVLVAVVIVSVALILGPRRMRRKGAWSPYDAKPLLSQWERRALLSLRAQIPQGFYVCPQVRLADMLSVTGARDGQFSAALSRIVAKSVDFAIIELATGRVALVVELDDKTHFRADRRARDRVVEMALQAAQIPLRRFRPNQRLDVRDAFSASASVSAAD